MSKLKQVLKHHGIDAANLDVLFGHGREAVQGLLTDGASAVELWRRLRQAAGEIGYWPVILGGDADFDQHNESFRIISEESGPASGQGTSCRSAMEIIAAGMKLDVRSWLTDRAAAGESSGTAVAAADDDEWPAEDLAMHHFTLPVDPEHGGPLSRVYVGLTPTVIGWQTPAYLRFGGWNGCPAPEHHVAMLKHWRQAYGAEVVGLGGEVLELAVSRPPRDRSAALRLAREQLVYCPSVIRHGTGSLHTRAAMLLGATAWSFWWE
jgi:hypothetical protein